MVTPVRKNAAAQQVNSILSIGLPKSRAIVDEFEATFIAPILAKLEKIKLREIIKGKNPYLYRATGVSTCEELTSRAFNEYISTMQGNYFGPFFESVARTISGGHKPAGGAEVDLEIRKGNDTYVYAIKSGAKGCNASSEAKARQDLDYVERRLRQDRVRTHKMIAFAYGRRKTATVQGNIDKLASKQFWAELSGDSEFYSKFLDACAVLSPLFEADMSAPYQRLLNEAYELFCEDETIRWDKVIRVISG